MVDAGGRAIIPPSMPGFGRPCKAARGLAAPWAGEEAPTGPLRWPPRPLSSAATMPAAFDPSAAAPQDSGIFGLPHTPEEAHVVLIPVPFEATTSYGGGTSDGPS